MHDEPNVTRLPRANKLGINSKAMNEVCAELEALGQRQREWISPNPSPFMNAPAERIVENCLGQLQSLSGPNRLFADRLMDTIAKSYLEDSSNDDTITRRTKALFRISAQRTLA